MSDVIGPNSYLPGQRAPLPEGKMCDVHQDRKAVARIVGETDSFGSELNDCCQECVDEIKNAPPMTGTCDWCKTPNQELRDKRDWEEGTSGRVYQICTPCNDSYEKKVAEEFADEEPDYDYYD